MFMIIIIIYKSDVEIVLMSCIVILFVKMMHGKNTTNLNVAFKRF